MDTLHVAFYIGRTRENPKTRFFDRLVCLIDGSEYSHAELVVEYNPAGLSLCRSSSYRDGGVREKYINLQSGHWVVIQIQGNRGFANYWFQKSKGSKYDWLGLGRTVFKWFPNYRDRFFCTEAIANMLNLKDPASFGPRKLYNWCLTY